MLHLKGALAISCTRVKVPSADCTLSWLGDAIGMEMEYSFPSRDTVTLYYGDADFGGQIDIFTCVKGLPVEHKGNGTPYLVITDDGGVRKHFVL